jgi:hypothetical protein
MVFHKTFIIFSCWIISYKYLLMINEKTYRLEQRSLDFYLFLLYSFIFQYLKPCYFFVLFLFHLELFPVSVSDKSQLHSCSEVMLARHSVAEIRSVRCCRRGAFTFFAVGKIFLHQKYYSKSSTPAIFKLTFNL